MTTRYTLNPEVREKIPAEFLEKWAEALLTSSQWTNGLSNSQDTSHCCLCVAARLEGAQHNDYLGKVCVSFIGGAQERLPNSFFLENVVATEDVQFFSVLNDDLLTHPQISHLITHGWVDA